MPLVYGQDRLPDDSPYNEDLEGQAQPSHLSRLQTTNMNGYSVEHHAGSPNSQHKFGSEWDSRRSPLEVFSEEQPFASSSTTYDASTQASSRRMSHSHRSSINGGSFSSTRVKTSKRRRGLSRLRGKDDDSDLDSPFGNYASPFAHTLQFSYWRRVRQRIVGSRYGKWGMLLCLCGLIMLLVRHDRSSNKPTPKPALSLSDIYTTTGALRRESQRRMSNPSAIPYQDLFKLESVIDLQDELYAVNVSLMLLPSPETTEAELSLIINQISAQTHQPASVHLMPYLTSYDLSQTELADLSLPKDTHFTLILPLVQSIALGPTVLQYLIHLAGTREFAGALLELGCAQGLFAQTPWLDKLNLDIDPRRPDRLSWRKRGLGSLQVPLKDSSQGINDFWIDGLQVCEDTSVLPAYDGTLGQMKLLVEADTTWENGWQDLACHVASRTDLWQLQVIFLFDGSDANNRPNAWCPAGHAAQVKSRIETLSSWPSLVGDAGIVLSVLGGEVEHELKKIKDHSWTSIQLPRRDLATSVWMAALDAESLSNFHKPRIDILVITNNRPDSLARLLESIDTAHYYGDQVALQVGMEQTTDRETTQLLTNYHWEHGTLNLRKRIILGGLMPAVVESWYPANNDSYGVFLEDDVEVSPLYYAWLKFTILKYRYSSKQRAQSTHLFGVSLYQPKNLELRPEGRQPFDAHLLFEELSLPHDMPYLSQVPCSWGAAYFPEIWREYHDYLSIRLSEVALEIGDIIVPDVRSNRWPKSWKKYFNELVYLRGYTMLYPNYADFYSFSTNHLEMGTHVHVVEVEIKKKLQYEVPLMTDDQAISLLELPDDTLPDWKRLPTLDLWGSVVTEEEIISRGWSTVANLATCAKADEPQPYDLSKLPTYNASELLCPREYEPQFNMTAIEDMIAEVEQVADKADAEAEEGVGNLVEQ